MLLLLLLLLGHAAVSSLVQPPQPLANRLGPWQLLLRPGCCGLALAAPCHITQVGIIVAVVRPTTRRHGCRSAQASLHSSWVGLVAAQPYQHSSTGRARGGTSEPKHRLQPTHLAALLLLVSENGAQPLASSSGSQARAHVSGQAGPHAAAATKPAAMVCSSWQRPGGRPLGGRRSLLQLLGWAAPACRSQGLLLLGRGGMRCWCWPRCCWQMCLARWCFCLRSLLRSCWWVLRWRRRRAQVSQQIPVGCIVILLILIPAVFVAIASSLDCLGGWGRSGPPLEVQRQQGMAVVDCRSLCCLAMVAGGRSDVHESSRAAAAAWERQRRRWPRPRARRRSPRPRAAATQAQALAQQRSTAGRQ